MPDNVDEAVERLLNQRYGYDWDDIVSDIRIVIARAEAAEAERDLFKREQVRMALRCDRAQKDRDAANAKLAQIAGLVDDWARNPDAQGWAIRHQFRDILNDEGTETNG